MGKRWTPAITVPQILVGIGALLRCFSGGDISSRILRERYQRLPRNELATTTGNGVTAWLH